LRANSASALASCCATIFFWRSSAFAAAAAVFEAHFVQLPSAARCACCASLGAPLSVVRVFIKRWHSAGVDLMKTLTFALSSRVSMPSFTDLP